MILWEGHELYIPVYSLWIHLAHILNGLWMVVRFNHTVSSLFFFGGAIFGTFLYYYILTTIFKVTNKKRIWITSVIFFILYFPLRHIGIYSIVPLPRFLVASGELFRPGMPFMMFQGFVNNFHYAGVIIALCAILKKIFDFFKSLKRDT